MGGENKGIVRKYEDKGVEYKDAHGNWSVYVYMEMKIVLRKNRNYLWFEERS